MIITLIGVAMFVLGIIGFLYYVSFNANKDVIGFLSSVGIIIGCLVSRRKKKKENKA